VEKGEIYHNKQPEDVILHLDESGFELCGKPKKCLTKKGVQPRLPSPGGRKRVNVVGAVDPFSGWSFFQYIKKFDAVTFLVFLVCLIAQCPGPGKIYLFLDNSRVHHAKYLRTFLAANSDKLQLVFLPSYSPEFNEEIEGVWREVKKNVVYNGYYANFDRFYTTLDGEFDQWRTHPDWVREHCNAAKYLTPCAST
jgi:putative transposase